jgi:thioesterase domain-containing protein/acyl carrier protein
VVLAREDVPGDRRLVGYVVRDGDPYPDAVSLREGLRSRLPDYMVPSAFVQLDELPLTSSGKVDRKALPAPDGVRPQTAKDYVAPRDAVELQLVQIWEELLDVRPIGVRDDFFDLGGHSLLAVRVMARIDRELGKRPDMAAIFSVRTVEGLATVLREQGATPPETAVVGLQTRGSKRPLFFVHPSGGSVHWYANLSRRLGRKQPFYGLQARGLNGNQELHTRIEDMAAYYVDAMRALQPEGPYLLGSWSFGVIVVFEMAQQFHAHGDSVEQLIMLDQGPHLPFDEPEDDAAFLIQLFGNHVPLSLDELRDLNPEAQIAHVLEVAKKIDWIYPEVTLAHFRHFVRILKTQQEAWRNYTARPYAGQITVIRSEEQVGGRVPEPDLGWGPFALGGVEVHGVSGNHMAMMAEPNVKVLAKRMKACLK